MSSSHAIELGQSIDNPALALRGSQLFGPDEEAVIPPGTPHTFGVEGAGARFIAEFRPPGRTGEFFQELFALPSDGRWTSAATHGSGTWTY